MISVPEATTLPRIFLPMRPSNAFDHFLREAVRIGWKGVPNRDTHHLPVARHAVLTVTRLPKAGAPSKRLISTRHTLDVRQPTQSQALQIWQMQTAGHRCGICNGVVGYEVAILRGIIAGTHAAAVNDEDNRSGGVSH